MSTGSARVQSTEGTNIRNDLIGSREYSFQSALAFNRMRERLGVLWTEGDSHYYGDYLARGWREGEESGWIRIYHLHGRYYCKFKLWTSGSSGLESWAKLQAFVQDELFPSLEAVEIRESDEID